ncbi:GtrA family protein [Xanthomonas campestris pv. spermacoces]|uniref:GtrA family protein n=1 Tax=Xanthomonas euvesicatoria TaxID=456327 RepID=UPI001C4789DE|nr:GtrA family protein [Xanthomonas campestris pv. spermacoces]
MIDQKFFKFLVAGGLAAVVNFGSRILLNKFMPYAQAIIIAYCIGMLTAFLLNRLFVFKESSNHIHQQAAWFILINVAAALQTLLISLLFAKIIFPKMQMNFYPQAVAHAIGVIAPVAISYLGHKHFTFRGHR